MDTSKLSRAQISTYTGRVRMFLLAATPEETLQEIRISLEKGNKLRAYACKQMLVEKLDEWMDEI